MLQLQVLRQETENVKKRLAVKNFKNLSLVDQILEMDDNRKRLTFEYDETKARINTASKTIGQLMAKGEKEQAQEQRKEVEALKKQLLTIEPQLAEAENNLQQHLVQLPNLPAREVPEGTTPADNEVVRSGGEKPALPQQALPHWELAKKFELVDFELGTKVTGSGFPFYTGKGARLQRALIQYFLDYNTEAGYYEVQPPLLVNEASAFGTGQLPDKEGQMYVATEDNFYLIPTSEVPLTNIFRDEILKEDALPKKLTAYTPCFRREAGSYGKDVRGLNRLHQFDKVEIVQVTHPDHSYLALDEMVRHVEQLLVNLELPYRILRLCGGDMSFTAAITYDFEVYSAAQDKWLEVSSVSNFESYQANRMKIRFKDAGNKTRLVHTLNGSSLALPRILACILENNQVAAGIQVPAVLQNYFGAGIIS